MKKSAKIKISATAALLCFAISAFMGIPETAFGSGGGYKTSFHACDAGVGGDDPWIWDYDLNYIYWASNDIMNIFAGASRFVWTEIPGYGYWWQYAGPTYGHRQNFLYWDSNRPGGAGPRSSTTYNNVDNGIWDGETYHSFTTFSYVGHNAYESGHVGFLGNAYGEEPEEADKIFDYDVDSRVTYPSNHHFVFLWVCRNANPGSVMPYAWTKTSLGQDGYGSPDYSDYCFIGFENASPFLSCNLDGGYGKAKNWFVFFYYYSVTVGLNIKQALDSASYASGFSTFLHTPMGNPSGYYIYWPGPDPDAGPIWGKMHVYGDGYYNIPGDIYES